MIAETSGQLIGAGVLVILSITMITYSLVASRIQQQETLQRRIDEDRQDGKDKEEHSAAAWFRKKAAPVLAKPAKPKSASEQTTLRIRLANAGLRSETAPAVFLASKSIIAVALLVLTAFYTVSLGLPTQKILGYTIFVAGIGFMLPEAWLYVAKSQRQLLITEGLPDSLDLMVVSVEAGLSLDAALQRVGQEMATVHPELSEEFVLCTLEVQMGITRSEALQNLALRTGVPELKSLAAILVQAEKFGTSVATALRVHAETLRVKRRQKAEEAAAKTAVKLVIPLILFIFPAIFVVLAGPAILKLFQTLTEVSQQGGGF